MEERAIEVYTDSIKRAVEGIPEELSLLSEQYLRDKVNPSIKHYELKRSFWEEYTLALDRKEKMRNWRVYDGRFSKSYFYESILKNRNLMAWIMTPLVQYEDKTMAALDKGQERYDELISMEITTTRRIKDPDSDSGYRIIVETDAKKALVLLQTLKNLEDRVKGAAIQRQVNINTSKPSDDGGKEHTLDMDKIQKRMDELDKKLNPHTKREITHDKLPREGKRDEARVAEKVSDIVEAESRRVESTDSGKGNV